MIALDNFMYLRIIEDSAFRDRLQSSQVSRKVWNLILFRLEGKVESEIRVPILGELEILMREKVV